ncbi:MAG: hypothetical protein WCD37_03255 [Chloroflexia bacterium]
MRKSVLLVMVMVSMLLMSACDNTPATPVPAPTATTAQSTAPTATTQQSNSNDVPATATVTSGGQATPATTGALGGAKGSTFTRVSRSAPKGDLTNRTLGVARQTAPFEALERGTPTVQPVATPTEEVATEEGAIPEDWTVILDSDFSDGDSGTWLTGTEGGISSEIDGDKLVMSAEGTGFYNWADETINWTDGYISATLELDGPGIVGLSARVSKTGGKFSDIVAIFGNNGNYAIYREVDGQNERVANGRSSAIKKNGVNEIALLGVGEDFTFFINGKKVRSFTEGEIGEGAWGTYIESIPEETTTASFSRILFMGPGDEPIEDPTATPEADATETIEPDDDVTPTATTGTTDETVILSTDFSEDGGTWLTGAGDTFRVEVDGGELVVESSTANGVVATSAEEVMEVADARIEATVRIEDASEDEQGFVGLSARSQEFATGYEDWSQVFCGINNSGAYSCNRLTMADDNTINFKEVLAGQTDSINDGEQNVISLTGKGSRWTFEINGTKVGSFTDNSVKEGAWGVLVKSGSDSTTGFFSKIEVFER